MDFMFDWEAEGDRFSFEDSDRFEEDSLCSWISEPESLCNNWRGWRKNGGPQGHLGSISKGEGKITSLTELAAQAVACHLPFEVVEHFHTPIPEQLQLRIAFWSFPENEEDIRLYSCLANGSADEFQKGEHLYKAKAVRDVLQIGFHLSATVIPPQTLAQAKGSFNVAVVFDRRRITSCNCTCSSTASWCAHVVALCLYRIHQALHVCLRAPVSESLSRLHRDQLQKFAQYLISELPQQILPTAQRLLDELLSSQQNAINTVCGAPDPTAGPSASEQTTWCLDESTLHENIKKTLIKFCVPSPIVFSDVNYLSSTAPPAAAEWQSLLRPLRGREPEGMWNLLSIIREMFRRHDSNAIPLLEILTDEALACEQLLTWWFSTKISSAHNSTNSHGRNGANNASNASQHAASSLGDEIVMLWRLAALNPTLSPIQRDDLSTQFKDWHIKSIDKVRKARTSNLPGGGTTIKKSDIELFPGFKPSIEACSLTWDDYVIAGITYVEKEKPWRLHVHLSCSKAQETECRKHKAQVSNVQGVDCSAMAVAHRLASEHGRKLTQVNSIDTQTDGALSSSSEGFCENFREYSKLEPPSLRRDSDSSYADEPAQDKSKSHKHKDRNADHGVEDLQTGGMATGAVLIGPLPACDARVVDGSDLPKRHVDDNDSDGSLPDGAVAAASNFPTPPQVGASGSSKKPKPPLVGEHSFSDAQQSSDEYQVYFYDTKAKLGDSDKKKKSDEPNYFAGLKKFENKQDTLFARAEALHAHGYTKEACKLAKQLAEEMLANPPDLTAEPVQHTGKGKKKKSQNNTSSFAITTLAKAAFLCNVLLEDAECHHLAFKVGMFGLEMPRQPASSKALEVKLANQESELAALLKKIPLGPAELNVIRDRAEQLRDGKLRFRGESLLPLMLASFIFDSLCLPVNPVNGSNSRPPSRSVQSTARMATDEKLGFEAALAALGLKANVSEAEHPLLCEGTRRQKGDLALAMLFHYKDDQVKLGKIMDKLLDKEVHQLYKTPSLKTYLLGSQSSSSSHSSHTQTNTASTQEKEGHKARTETGQLDHENNGVPKAEASCLDDPSLVPTAVPATGSSSNSMWQSLTTVSSSRQSLEYLNLEQKFASLNVTASSGARPKTTVTRHYNSNKDTDSSALEEDGEGSSDYKAWEAKFRCTNLKTIKRPSVGMASIDSSAPETTSSDNSPTLVRRNWGSKHQGPGSDSGSSGKSSDSFGSSSSGDKGNAAKIRDNESPISTFGGSGRYAAPHLIMPDARNPSACLKVTRHKNKNRMPTIPNQPSEALAHFMFELAKTVLTRAGGNSSTSLFTQPSNSNAPTGPHRNLHLCAFQIGLYALGVHNCVSPNWLSRTYSSHVSWITGQAMEIGSASINILIETWEGHLTPPEVASLADRASRGRDHNMVRAAAELALSCLPHAQALNPNEIQRALIQCKEQCREKLERACLAVESAAKDGGVYPEVLFDVAKRWYELYEETATAVSQAAGGAQNNTVHIEEVEMAPPQAVMPVIEQRTSPPVLQIVPYQQAPSQNQPQVATSRGQPQQQIHIPYTIPQPPPSHQIYQYSYMQQIPNFGHQYSQPHIQVHTHNMHPAYLTTYPYQNHPQFGNMAIQNLHPNPAAMYHPNAAHMRQPSVQVYASQNMMQGRNMVPVSGQMQPMAGMEQGGMQQEGDVQLQQVNMNAQHQQVGLPSAPPQTAQNSTQMNYLLAAYRVGMLAMETLARRVHDDRPQTKYARSPPYGEDVKWLLGIAKKLGTNYLSQFCASAVNAVVSPFVLQDIAIESAQYLSRHNPVQLSSHLRSPILSPLVQKCLQMFIQCSHQRISHITQAEYDEFVSIICSARNAFCSMTPGGMVQFNDLLMNLRKSKFCKKELWQRIVNGLATVNIS
ncbi:zinc finger SWIM domain-containing protein 8-like isoform X2 [Lineus longissimus]|uniref:zinc finger SWIM domain-containing protein 8-like isoform X2 n=1 Tax=Lineus longissimus TaxID=88925 RepID=UPI00315DFCFF